MAITNYPEYPMEQIEWLKGFYPTHSFAETYHEFNKHFGLELSEASVRHRLHKFHIKTQYDGRFLKGQKVWNEGLKLKTERPDLYQRYLNSKAHRFEKGRVPQNRLPVGSESKFKDFIVVKVEMPDKWIPRARYVYEKTHNCKLDKKDKILHLDGDKFNDDPSNLIKVTDAVLARLNRMGLITKNKDLTKAAVGNIMLEQKIRELMN